MRDYAGWTFRDRSFASALVLSVIWHVFWFVAISVNMTPNRAKFKADPLMVSLGPVLDDKIFSTLAKTRPQMSETFYRRLSDYKTQTASEVRGAAAGLPGRIVVLPSSGAADELRELVGGKKASLED